MPQWRLPRRRARYRERRRADVTERRIEVAALVGSLRRASYNRGLLRTAMLLRPDRIHLYEVPIHDLPFYSEDIERRGFPASVRDFRAHLERADALLICTPEYSYSIPGVLKNALDWAAAPAGHSFLRGRPLAMMGASAGRSGTMRAQLQLRQVATAIGMVPLPEPEVYVTYAADKFNQLGELTDQTSRDLVEELLVAVADWAELLRG
jgi:chromate reductase